MGPPRNYIWEASHSQIYPLLATLTEMKLVQFRDVPPGRQSQQEALQHHARRQPMTRRLECNANVNSLWLLLLEEAISMLDEQIAMTNAEVKMINGHMSDAEQRSCSLFPTAPGESPRVIQTRGAQTCAGFN